MHERANCFDVFINIVEYQRKKEHCKKIKSTFDMHIFDDILNTHNNIDHYTPKPIK